MSCTPRGVKTEHLTVRTTDAHFSRSRNISPMIFIYVRVILKSHSIVSRPIAISFVCLKLLIAFLDCWRRNVVYTVPIHGAVPGLAACRSRPRNESAVDSSCSSVSFTIYHWKWPKVVDTVETRQNRNKTRRSKRLLRFLAEAQMESAASLMRNMKCASANKDTHCPTWKNLKEQRWKGRITLPHLNKGVTTGTNTWSYNPINGWRQQHCRDGRTAWVKMKCTMCCGKEKLYRPISWFWCRTVVNTEMFTFHEVFFSGTLRHRHHDDTITYHIWCLSTCNAQERTQEQDDLILRDK